MTEDWRLAFAAAMDRRLDPISSAPLVVAYSGGGDSTALLQQTIEWALVQGRPVLAMTVDHALGPDSAQWTIEAGMRARALGAQWRGLLWQGEKPTTGIQAKARHARHVLLAEAARAAGAAVVIMGHTADDVAEGDLMRATDTPGLGRVREWGPSPVWPQGRSVFILRPILTVRRADLRAHLSRQGMSWFDDPANENRAFARVRARQSGVTTSVAPRANLLETSTASLAQAVTFDADGAAAPRGVFAAADPRSGKHVMAAALLSVSGSARPPRGDGLQRLFDCIRNGKSTTLAGCKVSVDQTTVRITCAPPRRGHAPAQHLAEGWALARFSAACGLIPTEAQARLQAHIHPQAAGHGSFVERPAPTCPYGPQRATL